MPTAAPSPTLYLFAGCNGAGKTTFARAYLRQLDPIPRFLNADELARGLSPFNVRSVAVNAGKLLLHEIDDCLKTGQFIPAADVRRRYKRSIANFLKPYAPLADAWTFRKNSVQPPTLLFDSASSSILEIERFLRP